MFNCIFTPHCTELLCDKSCPKFVETSYLLERNGIDFNNPVFKKHCIPVDTVLDVIEKADGIFYPYVVPKGINTVDAATLFTYSAICTNWKGNQLHCNVYNLKYSQYIEATKNSWTTHNESESLQYMRIWSESAKILIISGLDYVNFNDYEAQTLLSLIQNRQTKYQTTILICPETGKLVGNDRSSFYNLLSNFLQNARKAVGK